jgi:hypothetical protein
MACTTPGRFVVGAAAIFAALATFGCASSSGRPAGDADTSPLASEACAPDEPTTPRDPHAAACAAKAEAECTAAEACIPGYVGRCDCTCPGPYAASPDGGVVRYEARECAGCAASCQSFVACVPRPACEGADEWTCRSIAGCRAEVDAICDCTCADPDAKECDGCSAACRPFARCRAR